MQRTRRVDAEKAEIAVLDLLHALGFDLPLRDGMQDTPRRVVRAWQEFLDYDPGKIETVFETTRADQMIVVSGLRLWSFCEHHLLPFWCDASVGYIPTSGDGSSNRVLGLSKFARIAQLAAHKLQLQERLVGDISDMVKKATGSEDVGVVAAGRHLCLEMRGVRTPGLMVTSELHGAFRTNPQTRAEFLSLAYKASRADV